MVKIPAAQPVPRAIRSRRDDRYIAGHPAPSKLANSGYVVSIQDSIDTVTVDILDEQLPGVIPLGDMPPLGAIVEVEARGDLLVIPLWFEGPAPSPGTITVELPAQNVTKVLAGSSSAPFVDIVGGPSALFTRSPSSYVRFHHGAGATVEPTANVGYDDTTGDDAMGFDASVIPDGATLLACQWIAEGYYTTASAGGADVDDSPGGDFDLNYGRTTTTLPVTRTPILYISYFGDPYPAADSGYNLSTFPPQTASSWALDTPAPGNISPMGYVWPGTSARGDLGIGPRLRLIGYPWPTVAQDVYLTYLAIRVTYEEA